MASLLDPFGLMKRTLDTLEVSAKVGIRVAAWAGSQLSEALNGMPSRAPLELESSRRPEPVASSPEPLRDKMERLQSRALEQTTKGGQTELFHRILDQIVPDEARILSALSDGSVSPLVNVRGWSRAGILENASLVGRTANLALPLMTPTYVGHLLSLGLLQVGPEEPSLKDDYQILMAESPVLKAIKAGAKGPIPARIEKATVRLSGLGLALWDATSGSNS
jgi:hypothetical protein